MSIDYDEGIVSTQGLVKDYGAIRALDNVSLSIPKQSIFGILGPNGSGKTTLLSILMNVVIPQSGSFSIMGKTSSGEVRKQIGCLLETPSFYSYMSAEDNLRIAAKIKDADEATIPLVLQRLGLFERRTSRFSGFSLGMKQRLSIASSLLGNPSLIVFDEPTNGLDPQGISDVRRLVKELREEGKTVIIASHLLDEVEKVCTHVALLKKGKLLATGSVDEVLGDGLTFKVSAGAAAGNLQQLLSGMDGVKSVQQHGETLLVSADSNVTAASINRLCFEKGIVLSHLEATRKKLESWFIEATKNA